MYTLSPLTEEQTQTAKTIPLSIYQASQSSTQSQTTQPIHSNNEYLLFATATMNNTSANENSKTRTTNPPQSADTNSIAKPTKSSPTEEQNSLLVWDREMEDALPGLLAKAGEEGSLARILQAARQLEQQWIQSEVEESHYEEMMKAS